MMDPRQMILFGMEFMQMMVDFATEFHCPACRQETRSNLICLADDCDFMLYPDPDTVHPAFYEFVEEKKKEFGEK